MVSPELWWSTMPTLNRLYAGPASSRGTPESKKVRSTASNGPEERPNTRNGRYCHLSKPESPRILPGPFFVGSSTYKTVSPPVGMPVLYRKARLVRKNEAHRCTLGGQKGETSTPWTFNQGNEPIDLVVSGYTPRYCIAPSNSRFTSSGVAASA